MDTNDAIKTGGTVLVWLNDYGALQILAMIALIQFFFNPLLIIWAVCKLAGPISTIADWLRKHNK